MKSDGYSLETEVCSEKSWYCYLELFDDSNLYQTQSYNRHSKGGKHLSHLILKKNDKVIAIAQLRLFLIPFLNKGIAYLLRGPIWKRKGEDECLDTLDRMLEALYNEYVIKRKLVLLIVPNLYENEEHTYESIFTRHNFWLKKQINKRKTILIDLTKSSEELRKSLRRSWRQNLTKAERNDLILEKEGENNFSYLEEIHTEVVKRKEFKTDLTINSFKKINRDLPDNYKLNIMMCKHKDNYVSGMIGTTIGDTGLALIGGTTSKGLKTSPNSYYYLMWNMCQWAKMAGCKWFDLGGINPETNPGVYQFKSGMRGTEMTFLGDYQACKYGVSCIACKLLNLKLWIDKKQRSGMYNQKRTTNPCSVN
jgi:lipid II:glycine glycyltransferase (peptidoglycan interpeptide bridge formation enzyme)